MDSNSHHFEDDSLKSSRLQSSTSNSSPHSENVSSLKHFATSKRNLMPLLARVTRASEIVNSEDQTSNSGGDDVIYYNTLVHHRIQRGSLIVLHGFTKQSKVLARNDGDTRHYAIPLTYSGKFKIKQFFSNFEELLTWYDKTSYGAYEGLIAPKSDKVKITSIDKGWDLKAGDLVRVVCDGPLQVLENKSSGIEQDDSDEIHLQSESPAKRSSLLLDHFRCLSVVALQKIDRKSGRMTKKVIIPFDTDVTFEEVIDVKSEKQVWTMAELAPIVQKQRICVKLVKASSEHPTKEEDLPVNVNLELVRVVAEPSLLVSDENPFTPAFHLPLRMEVYMRFVKQLPRKISPLLNKTSQSVLSSLDRCVEHLPMNVYMDVLNQRLPSDLPHLKTLLKNNSKSSPKRHTSLLSSNSFSLHHKSSLSDYASARSFSGSIDHRSRRDSSNIIRSRSLSESARVRPLPVIKYKTSNGGMFGRSSKRSQSYYLIPASRNSLKISRNPEITFTPPTPTLLANGYSHQSRLYSSSTGSTGSTAVRNTSIRRETSRNHPASYESREEPDFVSVRQSGAVRRTTSRSSIGTNTDSYEGQLKIITPRNTTGANSGSSERDKIKVLDQSSKHSAVVQLHKTKDSYLEKSVVAEPEKHSSLTTRSVGIQNDLLVPSEASSETETDPLKNANNLRISNVKNSKIRHSVGETSTSERDDQVKKVSFPLERASRKVNESLLSNHDNYDQLAEEFRSLLPSQPLGHFNSRLPFSAGSRQSETVSSQSHYYTNHSSVIGSVNNLKLNQALTKNASGHRDRNVFFYAPPPPAQFSSADHPYSIKHITVIDTDEPIRQRVYPQSENFGSSLVINLATQNGSNNTDQLKRRSHLNEWIPRAIENRNDQLVSIELSLNEDSSGNTMIDCGPPGDQSTYSEEAEVGSNPESEQIFQRDEIIPNSGNLYNFDVAKFSRFLGGLALPEEVIEVCRQEKVDGQIFSQMSEKEINSLGLNHPLIMYFKKKTFKLPS